MKELEAIKARAEGHTEGPWRIETDSEVDYEQGIPFSEWPSLLIGPENADPSGWAKKYGETRRISEIAELCIADAELIAAAPKLLAALDAVDGVGEYLLNESPSAKDAAVAQGWNSARAAIRQLITEALQ